MFFFWYKYCLNVNLAEITQKGRNPRFIVTSLSVDEIEGQKLYEEIYCARGDMENRIKEQQLDLFATRTSGHLMRVNQISCQLWVDKLHSI